MREHDYIRDYLRRCRELSRFCSQDGWIDNDSVVYRVIERHEDSVLVAVEFTEVIMEGDDTIAGRVPCFGQLKLAYDAAGKMRAEVIY